MKRIRRITVEIVQQRQRMTMHGGGAALTGQPEGAAGPASGEGNLPDVCPRCGAAWILLYEPDAAAGAASLPDLQAAVASLNLHLQSTPGGRAWICRNSYDRLKETP